MKTLMDSLASALAAGVTLILCAVPSWYTHVSIKQGFASPWIYGFVVALMGVGLVLTVAFCRKATRGIAPSRQRKRR